MSDVTMTQRTAKALIAQFTGQANILTIPRVFVSMTGSLEAALFLSQCLYWSERTADPDGWFWKRAEHWQEELSLSEYQVRKARKILAPFGLETDLRTVNNTPTLFYRVDGDQLYKCILQFLQNASCENDEMHSAKSAGSTYTETTRKDYNAESAPRPVDIPTVAVPPEAPRDMQSTGRKLTPGVNAPKPTPGTPLPRDWAFNADLRAWAIDRGLTADQADDEHDQFCAHYWSVAHDKHRGWRADWLAAEHGWFLKRDQFVPQQKGTHRDNIISPDKLTAKLQGIAGRIATLNGADGPADEDVPRLRAYPIAR